MHLAELRAATASARVSIALSKQIIGKSKETLKRTSRPFDRRFRYIGVQEASAFHGLRRVQPSFLARLATD